MRQIIERIELPNQDRTLGEKENCKYLGILAADSIKQAEMREQIRKGYLRQMRKLLKTKLYHRNLIKEINTWVVHLRRHSGPFLKWKRGEIRQMDQSTKKLIMIHKALHPRDDIDRLYVSRKEEGKELTSIEDIM